MTDSVPAEARGQVTLREAEPGDTEACAQILFDAFGGLHDHHRFARDFPELEAATGFIGMWIPHPSVWGVVAEVGGRFELAPASSTSAARSRASVRSPSTQRARTQAWDAS